MTVELIILQTGLDQQKCQSFYKLINLDQTLLLNHTSPMSASCNTFRAEIETLKEALVD